MFEFISAIILILVVIVCGPPCGSRIHTNPDIPGEPPTSR